MHTTVPGPDGSVSYGGLCFPKDTNALLKYMQKQQTPSKVLESTIDERNIKEGGETQIAFVELMILAGTFAKFSNLQNVSLALSIPRSLNG